MFTEELQMIRQAEEQADALRRDAKAEAAKLIKDANTKAGKMADEAETKAKECYEAFLAEGQQTAQAQYEAAIADAEKLCVKMEAEAGEKQDRIVKFIAERIVKSSGNC